MDNKIENKDLKIPYKVDSRSVFEDSISRVTRFLSENKPLEQIINNTKLPFILSDSEEPVIFEYILIELSAYDSFKDITWILTCKQIPTPIKLLFNITENTIDNTTLVILEMSIVKRELVPEKYKQKIISSFEKICVEILNNLIIKLKNDSKDIYHYESKIFNYSREKIRDVINHFSEIMKERGYVTSFKKEDGIHIYTLAESNKIVKVKVNKVQFKEKNVKWLISYMPLGEDFKDFLVDWYFIKIEQDKTLLAINNIYSEQMEPDLKKELTLKKKLLFQIIEEELIKRYP
jgi:hypothetical protein